MDDLIAIKDFFLFRATLNRLSYFILLAIYVVVDRSLAYLLFTPSGWSTSPSFPALLVCSYLAMWFLYATVAARTREFAKPHWMLALIVTLSVPKIVLSTVGDDLGSGLFPAFLILAVFLTIPLGAIVLVVVGLIPSKERKSRGLSILWERSKSDR